MCLLATAALPRPLVGCWVWEGCSAQERDVKMVRLAQEGKCGPFLPVSGLPEHLPEAVPSADLLSSPDKGHL